MKTCDICGSTDRVVTVAGKGHFCREHYKSVKRMKAAAQSVQQPSCDNCGGTIILNHCVSCGHHLSPDGSVMRIGGGPDC